MKKNFVPINYIHMNNIINYVEENTEQSDNTEKEEKDILTDNYIYNYLE